MLKLTVIIPTLNENENLINCLNQPALKEVHQIIVADASDRPSILPQTLKNIELISSSKGRALQMNNASRLATGDILLFLHADTRLPQNAQSLIVSKIEDGVVTGCFYRDFSPNSLILKLTSQMANLRAKLTFWTYGDQAIFITREVFQTLQGYNEIIAFEDLNLCLRAKQLGNYSIIKQRITTSARRFRKGTLRTLLSDFIATACYLINYKKNSGKS